MTAVPLLRRKQSHEGALVMGAFYLLGSYLFFGAVGRSGRVVDWLAAGGWLFVGLWWLFDVRKAVRGKHELHIIDKDHARIVSNRQTVFEGSLRDLKRVVGDGGGYYLYPSSAFVYRLKSAYVSDELRGLLDAVCVN